MSNGTTTASPDLSRLIASAQATTQAINNLNQSFNSVGTTLNATLTTITTLIYGVPAGATILSASSGSVTNATATATLGAATGKTTYITGFDASYTGSGSATAVNLTVTGTAATLNYFLGVPSGVTNAVQFVYKFPTPIPASGPDSSIAVVLPSIGTTGNAGVNAYGFYV